MANNGVESRRLVIPPSIVAIVEDARKHPEKGHVLSRIHAHAQRLSDEAREDAAKKKRRRTSGSGELGHASITQNKFKCIDKSEYPQIQGSITVISDDDRHNNYFVCSGYLVLVIRIC